MFGSLGMPEILFILVLALLIFGPKRLPEMGRTLGRGLREFRRATNDLKRTVETEISADDKPPRPSPVKPTVATAPPDQTAAETAVEAAGAATEAEPPGAEAVATEESSAGAGESPEAASAEAEAASEPVSPSGTVAREPAATSRNGE